MDINQLFETLQRVNEMKDEPIITITKVVDDGGSELWAGDEFEFQLHPLYDEYKKDKEAAKRLADDLREVADMVERQSNENSET